MRVRLRKDAKMDDKAMVTIWVICKLSEKAKIYEAESRRTKELVASTIKTKEDGNV